MITVKLLHMFMYICSRSRTRQTGGGLQCSTTLRLSQETDNVNKKLSRDVVSFKNDVTAFILCKQIPTNECSLK